MNLKKKFISLGMAVALLLGVTGCNMAAPATVGDIGGVEIPAGVYLLAQYNAYSTVSGYADLATGETASDVKAVLKASCTGKVGDEDVTTDGADFVSRLTTRSIQYYAAVESKFAQLGATLEDAATAEAAQSAASLWETNGDIYTSNGINQKTVETYLLNAQKAQACLNLMYGADGETPVTEQEYTDYIKDDCYYIESIQFPLMDYSTYAFADDAQKATIQATAEDAVKMLSESTTPDTTAEERFTALYTAASLYLPAAFETLGSTFDSSQMQYYLGSQLYTPSDLTSFQSGGSNTLTDALHAVGMGNWTTVDLGTGILVARMVDPLAGSTVEDLVANNDLLTAMKSDEVQAQFYTDGAAMEQNLNTSAMNTYKSSKIKREA